MGVSLFAAVEFGEVTFSGRPQVDLTAIIAATWVTLFAWLNRPNQANPRGMIAILAYSIGFAAVFSLIFYVDGYQGDGRPILTWRWNVVDDSKLRANLPPNAVDGESNLITSVDLAKTSELDWPGFRGADRTGSVHGARLSRDWVRTPPRLLWRQPIGSGWSSFAVRGDYAVTQEQWGSEEVVTCYELQTGRLRWVHRDSTRFHEMTGGDGPRATPTIDSGRVYALGATGVLNCLDGATGRSIWSRQILNDAAVENRLFGMAASPLLYDGKVFVVPGGRGRSLVAYDSETGGLIWGAGNGPAAYSSPVVASLGGRTQILTFNADGLFSHDPHSGDVLWEYSWVTLPELNNVCQPIVLPEVANEPDGVVISSAYGKGAVRLDVSFDEDVWRVEPKWTSRQLRCKFSSCVLHGDYLFGLDEKNLTCLDWRTGRVFWRGARYGYGQLILVGDLLLIQAESGEIALVEATPQQFREVAKITAFEHKTWNHPVVVGSLLLVRNDREAACYELVPQTH